MSRDCARKKASAGAVVPSVCAACAILSAMDSWETVIEKDMCASFVLFFGYLQEEHTYSGLVISSQRLIVD
jgi:hypothetical protein